ncbi:MAG: 8-amino-7-oxononanoate synthase [Sedimentisphaerales bacterium]|nr:8-amino-7-oxononanoate synthase [Sedimentisphaerales bacterium]
MADFAFLNQQLETMENAGLRRHLLCIDSAQGPIVRLQGAKPIEKILFCSNNYLSLADHPRIRNAVTNAVQQYGYGACASRLISGTMTSHTALEQRFSTFFGKESALLFSSGWAANEALLRTLPQKDDLVLLDRFDHASILDGARAGAARFKRYRRDDPDRLDKHLSESSATHKYIVTESVFSMDGDTANLTNLIELKQCHHAILVVDEAHALGCIGAHGKGLTEDVLEQIDVIIAPLGKAIAATGAILAGPKIVIDYLINNARPFIYTTAPSPVNCAAVNAALDIIQEEPERRKQLHDNAEYLRSNLSSIGADIGNSTTHIVPLILGDVHKTVNVSHSLFDRGFLVSAIRPPTVPMDSSRLRISVQADHTKDQIDRLCEAIETSL